MEIKCWHLFITLSNYILPSLQSWNFPDPSLPTLHSIPVRYCARSPLSSRMQWLFAATHRCRFRSTFCPSELIWIPDFSLWLKEFGTREFGLLQGIQNNYFPLESIVAFQATRENVTSNSLLRLNQLEPRTSIAGTIFCAGGRGLDVDIFSPFTTFMFSGTAGDPFKSVEAYSLRLNQWFSVADMLQQVGYFVIL